MNTIAAIQRFLNKYGFRCINELKLEESTLHDDPGNVCVSVCTDTLDTSKRYMALLAHKMVNNGIMCQCCKILSRHFLVTVRRAKGYVTFRSKSLCARL